MEKADIEDENKKVPKVSEKLGILNAINIENIRHILNKIKKYR